MNILLSKVIYTQQVAIPLTPTIIEMVYSYAHVHYFLTLVVVLLTNGLVELPSFRRRVWFGNNSHRLSTPAAVERALS